MTWHPYSIVHFPAIQAVLCGYPGLSNLIYLMYSAWTICTNSRIHARTRRGKGCELVSCRVNACRPGQTRLHYLFLQATLCLSPDPRSRSAICSAGRYRSYVECVRRHYTTLAMESTPRRRKHTFQVAGRKTTLRWKRWCDKGER